MHLQQLLPRRRVGDHRGGLRYLPGRPIYAYVGGFHLYKKTPEEVEAFAEALARRGVERILTGHCTGDEAFAILKARLGERITQFRVGLETDI